MKKISITAGTKDGFFSSYDCQIAVIFIFGIGLLQRKESAMLEGKLINIPALGY